MPAAVFIAKSTTELIELRARQQPDDPAVYTGVPEPDNSIKLRSLSFSDVLRAVDRLAWHYAPLLTPELKPGKVPPPQVIAVLVTSAVDETLLELALAKLGLTPLLLSVNNSIAAVAHLSKITNATHLIYSPKFSEDARETRKLLIKEGHELYLVEDKRFPLWGEGGIQTANVKPFAAPLTPEQEADRPAVILHSSGSTGFPKAVYISHYGLIANMAVNQNKPGFSTLPVFHGYGFYALFRCMYPGKPMTLFSPHLPLTSANICAVHAVSPPTNQCFAVPYVIKLLGDTEEGTRMLASFDIVGFAGAPLPEDLGDRLTDAGVNVLSTYGSTETGSLMNSERDFATDKGWKWVRPFTSSKPYLRFEPQGNDTFEVVVLDGYPPKIQSNRPDNSFATKDLFLRNPECEDQYKYIGRLDDTLVHILGEKTNPVPMELCIRGNSPYVAEAIIFGAGKPQTGVLILPSELGKDFSKAQLTEEIWPAIELANSEAPSHSRILPEMVDFLPYGTDVPVATKMSILRPVCYAKFKDVIEDVYNRFEAGSNDQQKLRLTTQEEMEKYLLGTIAKAVGPTKATKLTRDVDLFAFGVDSLQATRVRNSCWKELDLGKNVSLGQNVVYEHPSIGRLAQYILSLQARQAQSTASHQEKMIALLEKYSARLQPRKVSPHTLPRPVEERVVLLTGATGSLGAHILHQLASSPIRKVICLSRATSHAESRHRVKHSLKQRMLPVPEDHKWESYAADPNVNNLGLTEAEYEAIRVEVTDVVHNAWPVNFVLAVDSFDAHIGGAVNLMNLCLQSPYAEPGVFYYSSSVSCRQGSHDPTCAEDYPDDPSTAAGTGYAQSKWVVEKLCERAAQEKNLKVGVLRIGQMIGDTVNGVWNETEAWPLLFKSANSIGALPVLDEHPQWLPVDYAGRGVAEIILQDSPHPVYHIVNPDVSSSWNDILDGLEQAGLKFERVDTKEWIERLISSDQDGERNPTIKLLGFFRDRWGGRIKKPMFFKTDQTEQVSKSIKASPPVTKDLIAKWTNSWRSSGFLS